MTHYIGNIRVEVLKESVEIIETGRPWMEDQEFSVNIPKASISNVAEALQKAKQEISDNSW